MHKQTNVPPIKRRRLSLHQSQPIAASNDRAYIHKQNPPRIDNFNPKLKMEFEFQLDQLLTSFPPLIDIIKMENKQQQLLTELYNVFISCNHSEPATYQKHTNSNKHTNIIPPPTPSVTPSTPPNQLHYMQAMQALRSDVKKSTTNYSIPANVLKSAKQKEISRIRHRVYMRSEKLVFAINDTISEYMKHIGTNNSQPMFIIDTRKQTKITNEITEKLERWQGGKYHMKLQTEKDCYKKTRSYWNAQKAQVLGNSLFAPILYMICRFVVDNMFQLNAHQKVLLFVEIYHRICEETIQFDGAMPRPLILNASYLQPNRWKDCCCAFLNLFGVINGCIKVNEHIMFNKFSNKCTSAQFLRDEFQKMLKRIKLELYKCRDMEYLAKLQNFLNLCDLQFVR